ncbi:hypothetical protein F5X68DRAFT_273186 [Plectosphaerella plurivora]|uniref:Uncharacterized protein n=1 Tax=Plectosphaerella plurivora TaxID=936078 RepID=A0A9P8VHB0_9PEZI|nr:hypothetical protein F5X68DRAFT_273186 [Plectosphaerella plurivora]
MEGLEDFGDFDWTQTIGDLANYKTPTTGEYGDIFSFPPPPDPYVQPAIDPQLQPQPQPQPLALPLPLPLPAPVPEQVPQQQLAQRLQEQNVPIAFDIPIDPLLTLTSGSDDLWGGESNTLPPPLPLPLPPKPTPTPQPQAQRQPQPRTQPGHDILPQYAGRPSVPTLPPTLPPPPAGRPTLTTAPFRTSDFAFDPALPSFLDFSPVPLTSYTASAPVSRAPSTRYPTPAPRAVTEAPPSPRQEPVDAAGTTAVDPFALPTYSPDHTDLIPKKSRGREVDYSKYYAKLPATPAPFLNKFQYNRNGEWKGHLTFDAKEIGEYIKGRRAQDLPLRIWIQNMPAGCNDRGGLDARTRKCRWIDCPSKQNTILKGFWRVAFDERPETSGYVHDPYMNAGYFHLFCFERCFDLVGLIGSKLDVRPDNRAFRREPKNPMAITRDCSALLDTFKEWMQREYNLWSRWLYEDRARRARGEPGRRRERCRENYLWFQLTVRHLQTESIARQSVRDQRGGISLDKHFGDLELFIRLTAQRVAAKRNWRDGNESDCTQALVPQRRQQPAPRRKRRRPKYEDSDIEEEPELEEVDYNNDNRSDDSPRSGEPTRRSKRIAEIKSRDASPIYANPPAAKRPRIEAPILAEINVKNPPRHGNALNKLITDADSGRLPPSHRSSGTRASFP